MRVTVTNKTTIEPSHILSGLIRQHLTIENPAYLDAERMGRSTKRIPEYLRYYAEEGSRITVPRGCTRWILNTLRKRNIPFELHDQRRELAPVPFSFHGTIRDYQSRAIQDVLARDFGVLVAPTGSGKTVMALAVIAERKQPTIIVVHTKELADQWVARIESFLGVPSDAIGRIGGGKLEVAPITVATVQTLYKCSEDVAPHFGQIIVDECHRTPARTFTEAVAAFDAKYMLGLSATPWRRDKLNKLIYAFLGDKVHEISRHSLVREQALLPIEFVPRITRFVSVADPSENYAAALAELTNDPKRNRLIASDTVALAQHLGGGAVLVLSDRKDHLHLLQDLILQLSTLSTAVLTGSTPKKERQSIVDAVGRGNVQVLLATGQLIGEGFDCPNLHGLVLATPIRFSGRFLQYVGRVLRPAPGKDSAVVVDYCDEREGVFRHSFQKRRAIIVEPPPPSPCSAVHGRSIGDGASPLRQVTGGFNQPQPPPIVGDGATTGGNV